MKTKEISGLELRLIAENYLRWSRIIEPPLFGLILNHTID